MLMFLHYFQPVQYRRHCIACLLSLFLLITSHVGSADEFINLITDEQSDRVIILMENPSQAPVTVRLTTSGSNIKSNCIDACVVDIESKKTIVIDEIKPRDSSESWRYQTQYNYSIGVIVEQYDSDFAYWPAFAHSKKYYLSQAFNGRFSHQGINAIDFSMPEGTAVHAARSGRVIAVVEHFKTGGLNPHFKDKANMIAILHNDGTVAKYVHLVYNGARVMPGDAVLQGEIIGYSGATGYGKGPHLHFEVARNTSKGVMETVPFLIKSRHGRVQPPVQGFYYSVHDGLPEFKQVYADEIDFTDYFNRETRVAVSGVKNRQFVIDDHVLIYIQNGKHYPISVEAVMTLSGYENIRPVPDRIVIKPATEKLIAVIYQKDKSQPSTYSFNYKYREQEQ